MISVASTREREMDFLDVYLVVCSLVLHGVAAMVVLVYIPLSVPVKLFMRLFVRPFRMEELRGKVVLITGASSGIGEELAYQYAKEGACLALVARRKQALKAVAVAARERGAPDVLVLPADVSDAAESRRVVEETVARFGKLDHVVANAGIWSICFVDEITDIAAFTKMTDVNFWGSVYPTYYALPHLKASKGKLVATCSTAARLVTSKLSFYNATKAAQLRFFETLRAELGSEVGITILTPGYVDTELTKGKAIQKDGHVAVNEEARDEQIGVFPVGHVERLCAVAMDSIRRGDRYVTWPSLYRPLQLVASLAPEIINCLSSALYGTSKDGGPPLGKRLLDATGAKRLFPASLLHPTFKEERGDGKD